MFAGDSWLDLSHPLSEGISAYPGDPDYVLQKMTSYHQEGYLVTKVSLGMHLGTHIDFPAHFFEGGKTASDYPLSRFIGKACRIECVPNKIVLETKSISEAYAQFAFKPKIIVLDTHYSKKWGNERYYLDYPRFETDFARFLIEQKIELLFTDLPSVVYVDDHKGDLHRELLSEDILIGENLKIPPELGRFFWFCALPLAFAGVEASIVRAVAKNI